MLMAACGIDREGLKLYYFPSFLLSSSYPVEQIRILDSSFNVFLEKMCYDQRGIKTRSNNNVVIEKSLMFCTPPIFSFLRPPIIKFQRKTCSFKSKVLCIEMCVWNNKIFCISINSSLNFTTTCSMEVLFPSGLQ